MKPSEGSVNGTRYNMLLLLIFLESRICTSSEEIKTIPCPRRAHEFFDEVGEGQTMGNLSLIRLVGLTVYCGEGGKLTQI